jgi:hypothetical protein
MRIRPGQAQSGGSGRQFEYAVVSSGIPGSGGRPVPCADREGTAASIAGGLPGVYHHAMRDERSKS